MSLNQFIDTGADNATVNDMKKSIAREEDLQKAMNRAGLVQKEVQVKGKNGQMFTRKQWVKASDAQDTSNAGNTNSSSIKDVKVGDTLTINGQSVKVLKVNDSNYLVKDKDGIVSHVSKKAVNDGIAKKAVNTPQNSATKVTDKKQNFTSKISGIPKFEDIKYDNESNFTFTDKNGNKVSGKTVDARTLKPGDTVLLYNGMYVQAIGTVTNTSIETLDKHSIHSRKAIEITIETSDGKSQGGFSGSEPDFSVQKITKVEDSTGKQFQDGKSSSKLDPFQVGGDNVTHYINRKKFPPTGFSSASLAGKNIGEVLSGQSKEFVSKSAKDEAIRATKEAIRSHKKGLKDSNYRDSLYSESKEKQIIEAATELLAKLEEIPVRGQSQSKSDDKSSSGKFKPSDFQFRSGGQDIADFVNSIDKELGVKKHTNGNVGFGTLSLENGASVNFGYDDTGAYATWNGSNFRDVKSLKSAMSGQKSDQGKMNHQTGVRDKKAPTMIEDYFAGNHSHDGKKALAGLLGKGYSREDIMEQAEKSGVTWKKNDHAGINWMRASMAIQKHLNNSSK